MPGERELRYQGRGERNSRGEGAFAGRRGRREGSRLPLLLVQDGRAGGEGLSSGGWGGGGARAARGRWQLGLYCGALVLHYCDSEGVGRRGEGTGSTGRGRS
jgi:hypothetical protein